MNEYRNRSGRRMAQPHQKTGLWTQYRRWVAGLTRAERIRYRLLQGAVIISLIIIAAFLILQSWIRVPELPNVDAEGGDILSSERRDAQRGQERTEGRDVYLPPGG